MISIQKEEHIRTLLNTGLSAAEIGRIVGVYHLTVLDIARAIELSGKVSEKAKRQIQCMLLSGVPIGAIEEKTRIPRGTIRAIRRVYYLQRRHSDGTTNSTCPTCGAIMFPGDSGDTEEGNSVQHDPTPSNPTDLAGIVNDLLQLRNLGLIKHPLFQSLANRAERALGRG